MEKVTVFAAKSFIFTNGEDEVKVKNHDWVKVPEWVTKTPLFKLAEIDGDIQIVANRTEQKEVEKTGTTTKKAQEKKEKEEKSSADKK